MQTKSSQSPSAQDDGQALAGAEGGKQRRARVALAPTAMAAAKIPVTRCLSIVIPPLYFNRIIVPMTGPKL